MMYEIYTWEKLRELERERRTRFPGRIPARSAPRLAPIVRFTGRLLRRAGAGLEGWAEPAAQPRCCEQCG
jgi:hypothetical protein